MEVTDIMIGDYVEDIDFGIGEVISINFEGGEYTITLNLIGDVTKPYSHVSPEGIKPILLTPEILVKNGFSTNGLDVALFDRKGGDDFVGAANIQYVHELQHAIKLCEIDKIIKL